MQANPSSTMTGLYLARSVSRKTRTRMARQAQVHTCRYEAIVDMQICRYVDIDIQTEWIHTGYTSWYTSSSVTPVLLLQKEYYLVMTAQYDKQHSPDEVLGEERLRGSDLLEEAVAAEQRRGEPPVPSASRGKRGHPHWSVVSRWSSDAVSLYPDIKS